MAGQWEYKEFENAPQRIRPETHWFHEYRPRPHDELGGDVYGGDVYGREDGRLWFSLQLTLKRAEELCGAFAGEENDFAALVKKTCKGPLGEEKAVTMAPTSHSALRMAIEVAKAEPSKGSSNSTEPMLGTDILVHPDAFAKLEALSKKHGIEIADAGLAVEGGVAQPQLEKDFAAKSTPSTDPLPPECPVIIATIDDGIGIANRRFRAEKETRIKHFLDLALIRPMANGEADELLGRSWNCDEISKLLGKDEEQIYRALGLIDPRRDLRQPLRAAVTHGTHVLDFAAGYDWQNKVEAEKAVKRPIIAVQFPTQVAENRSDTWLPLCLKRALDWILVKADEMSAKISKEFGHVAPDGQPRRLPLVVNGSFASMAGPQDGYSDVERRITQFIKTYRGGDGREDLCSVVLAAGNSLQLRAAAQMDILPRKSGEILLRVLPDDKTPNFVQIWLPKVNDDCDSKKPQQVKVSLVPPGEDLASAQPSKLNAAVEWKIGGHVRARIYHQCFPRPGGSRECITIATRPTADDQVSRPVVLVPSGAWRIRIKNTSDRELRNIDLRVHRDDPGMYSRSRARQSYFDDRKYEICYRGSGRIINDELHEDDKQRDAELHKRGHWMRVTRQGTLSSYAYAKGVLVVGGYRLSDDQPATYSSSGRRPNDCTKDAKGSSVDGPDLVAVPKESPALAGSSSTSDVHYRTKDAAGNPLDGPDLAAVSERSPAVPGIRAAGTYSGSVAILSGTSVAAPQVTRALADRISTRATAKESKASITEEQPKTTGAAEGLKAAVAAEEQKAAIPEKENEKENKMKQEQAAKAAAPILRPLQGRVTPSRPWRDGVGRLWFRPSDPKRMEDYQDPEKGFSAMAVISHIKGSQPFDGSSSLPGPTFLGSLLGRLLGLRGSVSGSRSKPVVY